MTANEFRRRFYALARIYPRLTRGGLNREQLQDLVTRVARRRGYSAHVVHQPWPWPATTQLMATSIEITIDSRRHPYEQLRSLAHEVGHVCLGHCCAEDDFWTDLDGPTHREEDGWAELFASIVIDRVVPPLVHIGREQFELQLEETSPQSRRFGRVYPEANRTQDH